jgi:hypothetical protein
MNIKQVRETADNLFRKRTQLMTLMQEIAENFYPQRADFTVTHDVGDEFADHLTTSYPVLVSRELSDQLATMLRPTETEWFHMTPQDPEREDNEAKRWLERATKIQRFAMYDRKTRFTRATKEADADFSNFGQAVVSVRLGREANRLLYRCWHLRDVAWMENEEGEIGFIPRRWKPTLRDLMGLFGNKNHPQIQQDVSRKPFDEVNCYHIICEADFYDGNARGKPYWSIYYDIDHDHIIEQIPVFNREYVIPRWQTIPDSQYAYSPATIVGLPDARLIQAMTYTLLEAGEKATNPPLVATTDAVKSDVETFAGGITWVDQEYDERLGEALRPLTQDLRGMPIGIDMQRDTRQILMHAFFLNKLQLPARAPEMTAYEVGQRIQEYIRGALPIFEPMEHEYNGAICEATFDVLMRAGAFGSPFDLPPSLQGADIQFRFKSPLHDAIEQRKGQKLLEMKSLIAEAVAIDQTAIALPDAKVALRDALDGIGVPAKWIRSETTVKQIEQAELAAQKAQQTLDAMQQGSEVAANLSRANKDMASAA